MLFLSDVPWCAIVTMLSLLVASVALGVGSSTDRTAGRLVGQEGHQVVGRVPAKVPWVDRAVHQGPGLSFLRFDRDPRSCSSSCCRGVLSSPSTGQGIVCSASRCEGCRWSLRCLTDCCPWYHVHMVDRQAHKAEQLWAMYKTGVWARLESAYPGTTKPFTGALVFPEAEPELEPMRKFDALHLLRLRAFFRDHKGDTSVRSMPPCRPRAPSCIVSCVQQSSCWWSCCVPSFVLT